MVRNSLLGDFTTTKWRSSLQFNIWTWTYHLISLGLFQFTKTKCLPAMRAKEMDYTRKDNTNEVTELPHAGYRGDHSKKELNYWCFTHSDSRVSGSAACHQHYQQQSPLPDETHLEGPGSFFHQGFGSRSQYYLNVNCPHRLKCLNVWFSARLLSFFVPWA